MNTVLSTIVITLSVLVFIVLYNLWSELYEYTGTSSLWARESVVLTAIGVFGITLWRTFGVVGA